MSNLIAYFDESGTDGRSSLVAVAGYVSTAELWNEFQNEWQSFLVKNGIEIFHATDLINNYRDFTKEKGWNKKRAESALRIADKLIAKYVLYGVATYTTIADCEKLFPLKDKNGKRRKFSAEYLISGVMAVNLITNWAEENGYTEPIELIFEDGAHGKGYLYDATKPNKGIEKPRGYLIGDISFRDKKNAPQLQAADRLVHLACKSINKFLLDEKSVNKEIEELLKVKLVKVHRMDGEILPELAKELNLNVSEIYENNF